MSSVQGSVSPMAITPSAITKWIGAVAQISRMLRRIPFQWRTLRPPPQYEPEALQTGDLLNASVDLCGRRPVLVHADAHACPVRKMEPVFLSSRPGDLYARECGMRPKYPPKNRNVALMSGAQRWHDQAAVPTCASSIVLLDIWSRGLMCLKNEG